MRVCIVGVDSTHSSKFGEIINSRPSWQVEISYVVGDQADDVAKLSARLGATPCESLKQCVDKIDFALILNRFVDDHFDPAQVALRAGVPVFIDKPVVGSESKFRELMVLARDNSTTLAGGSALRFSRQVQELRKKLVSGDTVKVAGPISAKDIGRDARFSNVSFYGSHVCDMFTEIVGSQFEIISCDRTPVGISVNVQTGLVRGEIELVESQTEFYAIAHNDESLRSIMLDDHYNEELLSRLFGENKSDDSVIDHSATLATLRLLDVLQTLADK